MRPTLDARELATVREVAHAFLRADHPGDVQQFALDRVTPLLGAQFSLVMQLSADGELLRPVAQHEWPSAYRAWIGALRVRVGDGPSGLAVAERRLVEIEDLFADPALETWYEVARELGFRSILAAPLETSDGPMGAVAFYFADATNLSDEQRTLVRLVADQLAAVTDKARRVDALRRANAALADANAELENQAAAWAGREQARDAYDTVLVEAFARLARPEDGRDASGRLRAIATLASHAAMLQSAPDRAAVGRDDVDPRDPVREAVALWRTRAPMVPIQLDEPTVLLPAMVTDRVMLRQALELSVGLGVCGACTADGRVRVGTRVGRGFLSLTIAWRGQRVLEPVVSSSAPGGRAETQLPSSSLRILQVRHAALDWEPASPYAAVKQAVAVIDLPLVHRLVSRLGGDLRLDDEAGPEADEQEIRLVFPVAATHG